MKTVIKIIISVLLCIVLVASVSIEAVHLSRGNLKNEKLSDDFNEQLNNDTFKNTGNIRIMSSNLLVHYKSWGGKPAKPRANKYLNMIDTYKPDVIGVQEMSDEWYSCLMNNLPDGYKMLFPVSTGCRIIMTAMIYNENTLELVESGNFKYDESENPRLRRVVWAVFKEKSSGKTFAVTNTHFSLLFKDKEEEFTSVMKSQAEQLTKFIFKLNETYNCPVFAVGDYNTMEDKPGATPIDIPEIYNYLAKNFVDTKYIAENKICGTEIDYDYPAWDHIFLLGEAKVKTFDLLSNNYLTDISDHYPIFIDAEL